MGFHTGNSINVKDDPVVEGQVILEANGIKFAQISPDGKLQRLSGVSPASGLQLDALGRVVEQDV